MGADHGLTIDKGAIGTAQVFHQHRLVTEDQPGVPARNQRDFDNQIGAGISADDVLPGGTVLRRTSTPFLVTRISVLGTAISTGRGRFLSDAPKGVDARVGDAIGGT